MQVLQQTSYISTLLTVQNVSGDDVLSVTTSSPSSLLPGLSPATNYSINITLMFRGGHLGTPVTLQATTMDGGRLGHPVSGGGSPVTAGYHHGWR